MEKKKMKLWKKLLLILLMLIIVHTTRNFIILITLANKFENYGDKTNYIAEVYSLQEDYTTIMTSYNKDGNYLTTMQHNNADVTDNKHLTVYKNNDEELGVIKLGENKKIALVNGNIVGGSVQVVNSLYLFNSDNYGIIPKIIMAFTTKITTDKCYNTKCYLVEASDGYKIWINKDTGITMREINGGMVTERFYQFDIVKDDDIVKPDISDCEIRDNNK